MEANESSLNGPQLNIFKTVSVWKTENCYKMQITSFVSSTQASTQKEVDHADTE